MSEIKYPAFDYDNKDHKYSMVRRADPRIGQYVLSGLNGAKTVLNVGAGTGSYEPQDRYVVSVEPSETMRRKRLELGRHPAINAKSNSLPFDDRTFDASLAILTIHHWPDLEKGLREVLRVTKQKLIVLTYDPHRLDLLWNVEYFPELVEVERRRYPELARIESIVGISPKITNIRIPLDCADGFQEAFYGRPEMFLIEEVRQSQSAWGFISKQTEQQYVDALRADLASGEWDRRFGFHRTLTEFEGAYRMLEFNLV